MEQRVAQGEGLEQEREQRVAQVGQGAERGEGPQQEREINRGLCRRGRNRRTNKLALLGEGTREGLDQELK